MITVMTAASGWFSVDQARRFSQAGRPSHYYSAPQRLGSGEVT